MHACTHVHTHVRAQVYTRACAQIHMHVHSHACTHACLHMPAHTYLATPTCLHACLRPCPHAILYACVCTCLRSGAPAELYLGPLRQPLGSSALLAVQLSIHMSRQMSMAHAHTHRLRTSARMPIASSTMDLLRTRSAPPRPSRHAIDAHTRLASRKRTRAPARTQHARAHARF